MPQCPCHSWNHLCAPVSCSPVQLGLPWASECTRPPPPSLQGGREPSDLQGRERSSFSLDEFRLLNYTPSPQHAHMVLSPLDTHLCLCSISLHLITPQIIFRLQTLLFWVRGGAQLALRARGARVLALLWAHRRICGRGWRWGSSPPCSVEPAWWVSVTVGGVVHVRDY